jgi:beta-galactosidase
LSVLDLTRSSSTRILSGHLNLGGANPQGRTIEFTNYYMVQDGKPCIPVMGEFHFSRYPHEDWEAELLKMKAGGVDIIATYVFWIHIEEDEGVFDWSGNRNLRHFIALCGRHQLQALVRIGPFAHGECRNGGLPDWLYGRPFPVRSNHDRYLAYVRRWYNAIAEQLKGLLFKDGGPVIGIQLENEYMHASAPWEVTFKQGTEWVPTGSDGVEHIAALKRLAVEAGLEVPIYTCTGWLNSPILEGEILPMQGGYAFTPWSPDPDYRQPPTREFLFRNRHLAPVVNGAPTYEAAAYPYACCEIGGGIQDTYYHRNIVPPEAVEALAILNLAGGANLIGYYMYHGGSNPVGKHSYMNEFTVPRISYDFQAPIREFGQVAESYRHLRLLHLFLKDFGDLLAPMGVVLPDDSGEISPENTTALRYAVRAKDGAGFLFLNNYQDHVEMQDIPDICIHIRTADRIISIPYAESLVLQKDVSAILPFGLSLKGVLLTYATTQLLTKIEDTDVTTYVFFAPRGMSSEYAFDPTNYCTLDVRGGEAVEADGCTVVTVTPGTDCAITLTSTSGETVRLLTLTRGQAERCCKQTLWQKERLIISDAIVVASDDGCCLYSVEQHEVGLSIYPAIEGGLTTPCGACVESQDGHFTRYTAQVPEKDIPIQVEMRGADRAIVRVPPEFLDGVNNIFLRIDYVGDIGNCFMAGKLVSDNFRNGSVWEIGLKHLAQCGPEMFILITPIVKKAGDGYRPTSMAFSPDTGAERLAVIHAITAVPEYRIPICRVQA